MKRSVLIIDDDQFAVEAARELSQFAPGKLVTEIRSAETK